MDTEQPSSAPFLERFPVDAWPTLLVVDPTTQRPLLRWLGSVTAPQLGGLLDDAERAFRSAGQDPLQTALAEADRLEGAGQSAEAARAYGALLARAPRDWPDRVRVLEAQTLALSEASEWAACWEAGRSGMELPPGHSRSDVLGTGLLCALEAPAGTPGRAEALAAAQGRVEAELADGAQLADDRSGLYELLVMAAQEQGRTADVRRLARDWLAFLNAEARTAPTPPARAALDPHRLEAARDLGDVAAVLPELERSQRDLPDDFEPSALLAIAYRELGRYPESLAASARAYARAAGPRRLRILWERAETYAKMGDRPDRERTLRDALALAASLPATQHAGQEAARIRAALDSSRR